MIKAFWLAFLALLWVGEDEAREWGATHRCVFLGFVHWVRLVADAEGNELPHLLPRLTLAGPLLRLVLPWLSQFALHELRALPERMGVEGVGNVPA